MKDQPIFFNDFHRYARYAMKASAVFASLFLFTLPAISEPDHEGHRGLEDFLEADSLTPRREGSQTPRHEGKTAQNLNREVGDAIRRNLAEEADDQAEVADYLEKQQIEGTRIVFAPWGAGTGRVGGQLEDSEMLSEGFPPAFCRARDGRVLILDAVNRRVMAADLSMASAQQPARPEVLFACPRDSVCVDIDALADGRVAVADIAGRRVLVYSAAGNITRTIMDVDPAEIAADAEGGLWVRDASSGLVLLFGRDLHLAARFPGAGAFLARNGGGAWNAEPLAGGDAPAITRIGPSGRQSPAALLQVAEGYYSCQARVLGHGTGGALLVEHLQGRDLDEAGERHEYFLEIIEIYASGGTGLRKGVSPFRARPFHTAPRLFYPWGPGRVATFFFDDTGYTISVIDLAR